MPRRAKYMSEWLENSQESVQKLQLRILGRKQGSEETVTSYCTGIRDFCNYLKIEDPDQVIEQIRNGNIDITTTIDLWIDDMTIRKLANKSMLAFFFGVKKWLKTNGIKVEWDEIELPSGETVEEDRAPTSEELRDIINLGCQKIHHKTITLCAKSSGLRPGTLLSLRWEDLDFNTFQDVVVVVVKAEKGRKFKGKKIFITFFDSEAKRMLLKYKEELERNGETITPETKVFNINKDAWRAQWSRILKRANKKEIKRKWNMLHFYTLRKFFETRCKIAGVSASFYQHWMCHKGGKDPATYLDSAYFRPILEEHYKEYKKAMPELACLERRASNVERIFSKRLQDLQRKNAEMEEFIHTTLSNIMKTLEAYGMTIQDVSA